MSSSLTSRSDDLKALVAAGYAVTIRGAYLIVGRIPYVTASGGIAVGAIVTSLDLVGDESNLRTKAPARHTVWWTGETPYTASGENMGPDIVCNSWSCGRDIGEEIVVYQEWSRKPLEQGRKRNYFDYKEKIETYIEEVAVHADAKQPGCLAAAKLGWAPDEENSSRFHYVDTNSYRGGTKGIEKAIEDEVVAVVGVGGSGSYLVDILAKTNVKELHLYDDDVMEIHNAFRVPGAARVGELGVGKSKVNWLNERYTAVRKAGLHIHDVRMDEDCFDRLRSVTTAFIAVDKLPVRRRIQDACTRLEILHLSLGIGIEIEGEGDDQLGGNVKIEINYKEHARDRNRRIAARTHEEPEEDNVYGSNIQTAELNMLSAALAIAEWKAIRGIYRSERDDGVDTVIYSSTTGRILTTKKGK